MKGFGWNQYSADDENAENGGFWPSFADIMMLIVMIFLMVMMVLLVKNWELVTQLNKSILAEKSLSQLNTEKDEQNKALKARLQAMEKSLSHQQYRIFRKEQEIVDLELKLEQRQKTIDSNLASLALSEERIEALQAAEGELRLKLESSQRKNETQDEALKRLEAQLDSSEKSFETLKTKYNKLLRPARSPKGKFVVEVSYIKSQEGRKLFIKKPDETHQLVNELELNRRLRVLQREYPKKLYLKISFPKGDLISHQEAWEFTNKLLEKYDYYYQ